MVGRRRLKAESKGLHDANGLLRWLSPGACQNMPEAWTVYARRLVKNLWYMRYSELHLSFQECYPSAHLMFINDRFCVIRIILHVNCGKSSPEISSNLGIYTSSPTIFNLNDPVNHQVGAIYDIPYSCKPSWVHGPSSVV